MHEAELEKKSCVTQLYTSSLPDNASLEDLRAYAQAQQASIVADESDLARSYWRLGRALAVARVKCKRREWGECLATWEIDKTRASKARAIHRTFANEEVLAGLTVEQAYRLRKRKIQKRASQRHSAGEEGILAWLRKVCQRADAFRDEAKYAKGNAARTLAVALDETLQELVLLRSSIAVGNEKHGPVS